MKSRLIILFAVLAAFAALVPIAAASGGGTEQRIALHPGTAFPAANGKAVYKVNGTERELQIEVQDLNSLKGKHINVFVNGSKLGSPLVNSLGNARLERNTDRGQFVPRITDGSRVVVRTIGGTLIVSGTF
jgi:hypothetical protein